MDPPHVTLQPVLSRVAKRRFLETEKKGVAQQEWRRVGEERKLDKPMNQDSGPSAQVGECDSSQPAARSTNSSGKEFFKPPIPQPANTTKHPPSEEDVQDQNLKDKPRKLVAAIPDGLLSKLRANCEVKASTSLLGRIQGKHPGLKILTTWARETLHPSLTLLSLKSNNFFEVTFASQEGRIHALKQTDLICASSAIFFSSWRPHVNSGNVDKLDYPVWVQVVNLCQILREESFLRTIGEQLGQVIDIDNSDMYKAKLYGPRMRILVPDINNLPQLIVLPRLDGEGVVEYTLAYSGLPHQCGPCRSRNHQVRNCPRKDTTGGNQEQKTNPQTTKRTRAPRSVAEVLQSLNPEPVLVPDNVQEVFSDHATEGVTRWQQKTASSTKNEEVSPSPHTKSSVLKEPDGQLPYSVPVAKPGEAQEGPSRGKEIKKADEVPLLGSSESILDSSLTPEPVLAPETVPSSDHVTRGATRWQPKSIANTKNEEVSPSLHTATPVAKETDGQLSYSALADQQEPLGEAQDDQSRGKETKQHFEVPRLGSLEAILGQDNTEASADSVPEKLRRRPLKSALHSKHKNVSTLINQEEASAETTDGQIMGVI